MPILTNKTIYYEHILTLESLETLLVPTLYNYTLPNTFHYVKILIILCTYYRYLLGTYNL